MNDYSGLGLDQYLQEKNSPFQQGQNDQVNRFTFNSLFERGLISRQYMGTSTVNTPQLLDQSVTNAKIVSLTADKITAGTIDASLITVTNLNANNITSGSIGSNYIASLAITAGKIAANSVTADKISVGTLSAITANLGTVTAGAINGVVITSTDGGSNRIVLDTGDYLHFYYGGTERARLRGAQATNATGLVAEIGNFSTYVGNGFLAASSTANTDFFKFFCNNGTQGVIQLPSTNQAILLSSDGSTNNFTWSTSQAYSEYPLVAKNTISWGISQASKDATAFYSGGALNFQAAGFSFNNVINMSGKNIDNAGQFNGGDFKLNGGLSQTRFVFKDTSGNEQVSITPNGTSSKMSMNGQDMYVDSGGAKHAIVPTKKGFRALYCVESPNVWFVDFTYENNLESCDPIFLEVTEGKPHFIYCGEEDGKSVFQVWRKRKGHPERFEEKTQEEFEKNEAFLRMAKV